MKYSIAKKEIAAQPVLMVKRRVKPSEVAATLAEVLGYVFAHAQQNGIALAGQPLTRYLEWGPGLWTIEAGMPVTALCCETSCDADVRAGILPGGFVATTTHAGSYDKLNEAHAAIQQWIQAEGLTPAGAPWESYTTDPADYPDPKDWKTEIFWPLAKPQTQRGEAASKPVVYHVPGMDAVTIQRDIPYQTSDAHPLTLDLYRPPEWKPGTRFPAVIFVVGYSDLGAERMLGCKFKDMESYITWAKLVAASGLIGITYENQEPMGDLDRLVQYIREHAEALGVDERRIGLWSCSGNVPRALALLMQKSDLKCAALCYGVTLDLDGATGVAEAAKMWRFANPTAGKSVQRPPTGRAVVHRERGLRRSASSERNARPLHHPCPGRESAVYRRQSSQRPSRFRRDARQRDLARNHPPDPGVPAPAFAGVADCVAVWSVRPEYFHAG